MTFRAKIRALLSNSGAQPRRRFSVEPPPRPEQGDYATNIAFGDPAAAAGIAQDLARRGSDFIADASVAGSGFINVRLSDTALSAELRALIARGGVESRLPEWDGKRVMIEFTDPNPFKEFHLGHLYSNTVGEALARLMAAGGATVKRANYQGDVGMHVAKAVWGMRQKLLAEGTDLAGLERRGLEERVRFLGQAYAEGAAAFEADEEAKAEITKFNRKIFTLDPEIADLYTRGRAWSLEYFDRIYRRLGTAFDFYYFERDVGEVGLKLAREQLARNVFEESEGAVVFPGERYGLHRRVFINSEGLPTYEAKELGLAPTKYRDFPYDRSVIVTGSEIVDYFRVLLAALRRIDPALAEKTVHVAHGMVRLAQGKMSSRTGEVMRAEDLLDEVRRRAADLAASAKGAMRRAGPDQVSEQVAVGAVKYSLLRVGLGKDIVFDIDTSLNLEGDSGPYLQYTHARLKSILRKLPPNRQNSRDRVNNDGAPAGVLGGVACDALEHHLLAITLRLPEVIEDALTGYTPNTLTNYLHELAQLANEFYHTHPVMQEPDAARRELRTALVAGVALTLENGLNLLGIEAPEEM